MVPDEAVPVTLLAGRTDKDGPKGAKVRAAIDRLVAAQFSMAFRALHVTNIN
jgi:hypothetical protein